MLYQYSAPVGFTQNRTLTSKSITTSIDLLTNSDKKIKVAPGTFQLNVAGGGKYEERPLSVLLCWLMSEKKHVMKYARFYLDQGFDVLTVRINPKQLLWPVTGSQVCE